MSATAPLPDEPRPLTDRERRILTEIGHELAQDAPKLADALAAPPRPPRRRPDLEDVAVAVVCLVIAWVVMPADWFAVVVPLAVMVAVPALASRSLRRRPPGR